MSIGASLVRSLFDPATAYGALVYALAFFLAAWVMTRFVRAAVRRAHLRHSAGRIDWTAVSFVERLAEIFIYLAALTLYAHLIPALSHLGTALLAGVGVASVVLGLAAQQTLGNLAAGIALLLYRPFRVGDRVQIITPSGLETGTVENLTLGYTILRTFDNRRVVVPNSVMSTQVTINLTTEDPRTMAIVPFGISYDADIVQARSILIDQAKAHPLVQEVAGCPVTTLGPSSVVLSLRAWCADAEAAKRVEFDLYEQVKSRFDAAGIEIPLPYMNVILKDSEGKGNGPSPAGR